MNEEELKPKIWCSDCGKVTTDYRPLGEINVYDFFSRVDPGGEVPAGECLACGAFCYLVKAELDEAEKQAYINSDHNRCPFCHTEDDGYLSYGSLEVQGKDVFQSVGCTDCDTSWYERYAMDDIVMA